VNVQPPADLDALAGQWLNGVIILQRAHYRTAKLCSVLHFCIGIPLVLVSATVGTAVFATLKSSPEPTTKIVVGLLSVAATVLAGLQTFLGLSERAEKHKQAGVRYGALRRELELEIVNGTPAHAFLSDFRGRWDAFDAETPTVPQWVYERARRSVMG
jgi:hypothetical protein